MGTLSFPYSSRGARKTARGGDGSIINLVDFSPARTHTRSRRRRRRRRRGQFLFSCRASLLSFNFSLCAFALAPPRAVDRSPTALCGCPLCLSARPRYLAFFLLSVFHMPSERYMCEPDGQYMYGFLGGWLGRGVFEK